MNTELSDLKNDLSLAFHRFIKLAETLHPDNQALPGVCGKWSTKDVISHLIGWDNALSDFITNPDSFDPQPLYDVDTFNAKSVSDRHTLSWQMAMTELNLVFSKLEEALVVITPDMKIYDRVKRWLHGRIEDYHFHSIQLQEWIQQNQCGR